MISKRIRNSSCPVCTVDALRTTVMAILLCTTMNGCREQSLPESRIPTFPVKGTLLIDGVPALGAMVKFYSAGRGGRTPTAIVKEDGSFAGSFYDNEDGVPAGEYKLLLVWMQTPPEGGMPQDRLRGQFLDPAKRVATVTVIAGENRLEPIRLTSNASK
jgi:hypothetical protein